MARPLLLACLALGCVGSSSPSASAQCRGWDPRFAPPGVDGTVNAAVVFDDGSGPALYLGGSFSAAGDTLAVNVAKWDGISWSRVGSGAPTFVHDLAVFDDGSGARLYAACEKPLGVARFDGTNWTTIGSFSALESVAWRLAVFDDGTGAKLHASGPFTTVSGVAANSIASWDGSAWAPLGSGLLTSFSTGASVRALCATAESGGPMLYVGGNFASAGGATIAGVARWNGAAWSAAGAALPTGFGPVRSLAVFDDGSGGGPELYCGGEVQFGGGLSPLNLIKRTGSTWSVVGGGVDLGARSMLVFDDGSGAALFCAGSFTEVGTTAAHWTAKWDGVAWSSVGGGIDGIHLGLQGGVEALVAFDSGHGPELVAVGEFDTAGAQGAASIARLASTGWEPVSTGLGLSPSSSIRAFATFDDGSGAALYAAGDVRAFGELATMGVARFDGLNWSSVGAGLEGDFSPVVSDLLVWDDGSGSALYAGGSLNRSGATALSGIARWDGATWSSVGAGFASDPFPSVSALAVYDGGSGPELYAAGDFFTGSLLNIARWNGAAWLPLAAPGMLLGPVRGMEVFDDGTGAKLYLVGDMSLLGAVSVTPGIITWDGTQWGSVSTGINGQAHAIALYDDGGGPALFIGGEQLFVQGVSTFGAVKWDGTSWSALGPGIQPFANGRVTSLTTLHDAFGDRLYAAGRFQIDGTPSIANVAAWNGQTWAELDGGVGAVAPFVGSAYALGAFDDGSDALPDLYVGGDFDLAGSAVSSSIAAWRGCSCAYGATVYCTAKVNSLGCTPTIAAAGSPSIESGQPFLVVGTQFLNQLNGLLVYGPQAMSAPFQGGRLCVKLPVTRTSVQNSFGNPLPHDCSGAYHFDFNAHAAGGGDPYLVPGSTVHAQYWARDPQDPTGFGSSLSAAVRFVLCE